MPDGQDSLHALPGHRRVTSHPFLGRHQSDGTDLCLDGQIDANPDRLHIGLNLTPAAPARLRVAVQKVDAEERLIIIAKRSGLARRRRAQQVPLDLPGFLGNDLRTPLGPSLPNQAGQEVGAHPVHVRVSKRIDWHAPAVGLDRGEVFDAMRGFYPVLPPNVVKDVRACTADFLPTCAVVAEGGRAQNLHKKECKTSALPT
ncbi:MAG: hypothetical protein JW829_07605 [Pirellulales bacterium]|nr:hypothetical protein [Pirellulales bacterium]